MLKSLDILIGLSVIMLVLSMAVTLINQALLTVLASRGRYLREGLSDLLVMLDAGLTRSDTNEISARVLSHPLIHCNISLPAWIIRWLPGLRFGEVIQREELVKMLLMFGEHYAEGKAALVELESAIGAGASVDVALTKLKRALGTLDLSNESGQSGKASDVRRVGQILAELGQADTPPATREALFKELKPLLKTLYGAFGKLLDTLKANEIGNPGEILKAVRTRILELERVSPELANDVRQSQALLESANSEFLAKVNSSFDQFMERVGSRFTYHARIVTFCTAAALAVALQLDTVALVNRLAMDDQMRSAFVEQAATMVSNPVVKEVAQGPQDGNKTPTNNPEKPKSEDSAKPSATPGRVAAETERFYLKFLAEQGVIGIPTSENWCQNWEKVNKAGILVSILLLSLGAPFWYSTLSQLLQMRSVLAQRDKDQRAIRQTTQTPPDSAGSGPA